MKYLPLIVFLFLVHTAPVAAQGDDYSKARLISSVQGMGDLGVIDMGLEITLKDQWYTYWRMPGDTGVAPVFDWAGSSNVKDVKILWPTPRRFETLGMNSFGYDGTVLFPLRVTPEETGKDITLNLKLDLMVCHDICIPQTITMGRVFTAGAAEASVDAPAINSAIDSLPANEDDSIAIGAAILGKNAVVVTVQSKMLLNENTDMIIETPRAILTQKPEIIESEGQAGNYVLKIKGPENVDLPQELFGKPATIILIHDNRAIEKSVTF